MADYGLGLKVLAIDEKGQVIRGTAMFSNAVAQAGEEVVVAFRDAPGAKAGQGWNQALANLNKGMAKPLTLPGTRAPEVMIENVFVETRDGKKILSGKWVRTAFSPMKSLDAATAHDRRSLQTGWVTQPVLRFANPDKDSPNEPDTIIWPVTATTYALKTRSGERRTFDLAWLAERLDGARKMADSPISMSTQMYAVNHKAAARILTAEQALQAVATLFGKGQAALLVPTDAAGAPMPDSTRYLWAKEGTQPELPAGNGLRVIPVNTLYFGKNSVQSITEGMFSQDKAKKARLNGYRWLFPEPFRRDTVAHVMLSIEQYMDKATGQLRFAIWSPDLPKFEPGNRQAPTLAVLCAEREKAQIGEVPAAKVHEEAHADSKPAVMSV